MMAGRRFCKRFHAVCRELQDTSGPGSASDALKHHGLGAVVNSIQPSEIICIIFKTTKILLNFNMLYDKKRYGLERVNAI